MGSASRYMLSSAPVFVRTLLNRLDRLLVDEWKEPKREICKENESLIGRPFSANDQAERAQ
ncbi:hypothetical protein KBA01_13820 [Kozakia baliensis]|nr:hypothetical protein KBA01_13820 [Kozakia baliensis]